MATDLEIGDAGSTARGGLIDRRDSRCNCSSTARSIRFELLLLVDSELRELTGGVLDGLEED